jgi:hypothetical protein
MEKKKFWLGMLAVALVFGMTVVGCGGDDDDDDGGSGGTFTLTNIPNEYNGNYAMYSAVNDLPLLVGAQSINLDTGVITCVRIANGSVSLPMWVAGNSGYTRFSGNRTTQDESYFLIVSTATVTTANADAVSVDSITLPSITFSNGNATKSWNDQIE